MAKCSKGISGLCDFLHTYCMWLILNDKKNVLNDPYVVGIVLAGGSLLCFS